MGFGDFGSNGSVHWNIGADDGTALHGRDPKKNPQGFAVTLRFPSYGEAIVALAALIKAQEDGSALVTIQVPGIPRKTPNENKPYEVQVQW